MNAKAVTAIVLGALVLSTVAAPAALADDENHGLQRISKGDPFAACPVTTGPDETNYAGAEVEPFLAVGPQHELVGVWQQDRFSDGGARGLMATSSTDGKKFRSTQLPLSRCAPGGLPFDRASDPWVSIGPDGTVYASGLGVNASDDGLTTAVNAAVSSDHGRTWRNATTLKVDRTSDGFFNDKGSVTADPRHAGVAYVVWNRAECPQCNGPDEPTESMNPGWFSRTIDSGRTWSAPKIIAPTPNLADTEGHVVVVDPRSGRVYDLFDYFTREADGSFKDFEAVVHSDDMGATWSPMKTITETVDAFLTDPNSGTDLRVGNPAAPTAAVDPNTGTLYVAWVDATATGGDFGAIVFSQSTDRGATFSAPQRVSRDTGRPAFTPALAVGDDGTVGVSYFDLRTLKDSNTTSIPTSYWLTTMQPGEHSFDHETAITDRPFDMRQAPIAGGYFVGDYHGLVTDRGGFVSLFASVNNHTSNNPTDIFLRRLDTKTGDGSESDDNDDD